MGGGWLQHEGGEGAGCRAEDRLGEGVGYSREMPIQEGREVGVRWRMGAGKGGQVRGANKRGLQPWMPTTHP